MKCPANQKFTHKGITYRGGDEVPAGVKIPVPVPAPLKKAVKPEKETAKKSEVKNGRI